MKKIELLAPAGNMDALKAAVQAGCDAVYLGGNHFGARAFSKNFDNEEIILAIKYCHLYGVKVYVTVNTLIYDDEVNDFIKYIEFLHINNVDAVLVQDFGMMNLIRKTFPNLEVHASTQMHIHNLDGIKVIEQQGIKRIVLARETSIDDIKKMRKNSDVELEVFVHGALCISYSGQCLMSSLIGGRSGNRGACAGTCRLKYDIIDGNGKKLNRNDYPISTKDLNTLEYIGDLIDAGVDSLKIEGRMKSKEYVYMVVKLYRTAIDSYYDNGKVNVSQDDILKLKKIFNRNYTKGFLFNANNNDLINEYRPNHMGVNIGSVVGYKNGYAKIKLEDTISIGSGLRVIGKNKDVGISVNDFYVNGKLVKEAKAGETIKIKVNDKVFVGDSVVITLDHKLNNEIDELIDNNLRKVAINGKLVAKFGERLCLTLSDGVNQVTVNGNLVDKALNKSTDKDMILEKISRIGNTIYKFSELTLCVDENIFIPLKELNDLRREAVIKLDECRLNLYKSDFVKNDYSIEVPDFPKVRRKNVLVTDRKSFNELDEKYDTVFCEEAIDGTVLKLPRVIKKYIDTNKEVMIGEIGGFNKYKDVYTDFSLNVTNSYTVAFLHSLGAKMVCLSYELNDNQIKDLVDNYHKRYGKHPNLELIVSGYEEVMVSKFSLGKYYNQNNIYLRDMFGNKYRICDKHGLMYIYNYKKRDIFSKRYYEMGINYLRFNIEK